MSASIILSRYRLHAFTQCRRKFQLSTVTRLAWPTPPVAPSLAAAFERGAAFHRLLEQYFLGMAVAPDVDADADVQRWWSTFHANPPAVPGDNTYPEASLTVPLAGHFLFGRYDLLVLGDQSAHIYDWKTERHPRKAYELREDWQTRLYLALLVEGAGAFGRSYAPDQIALTYWFANAPEQSVTLRYHADWHQHNLAELTALVERIDRHMVAPNAVWPLTDDLSICAQCGYRAYCGRTVVAQPTSVSNLEMQIETDPDETELEPDLP